MDRAGGLRRLTGRASYLAVAAAILFVALIPGDMNVEATRRPWPAPDLIFAVTFAFALRRPDFVPLWAVAAVLLTEDVLTGRPPGLWSAIGILAFELVRRQERRFLELGFLPEWLFMAGTFLLAILARRTALFLALVPQPAFATEMLHYFVTVAVYPAVVLLCYLLLGLRKLSPEQAVAYQNRI